jgi:hypothetical protein
MTVLNMRAHRKATGSVEVPPGAIYIGGPMYRGGYRLPGSKWRNPFQIDKPNKKRDGTREEVVARFRAWLCDQPELLASLPELRGHHLVCWCAPLPCHGDLLLEFANACDGVAAGSASAAMRPAWEVPRTGARAGRKAGAMLGRNEAKGSFSDQRTLGASNADQERSEREHGEAVPLWSPEFRRRHSRRP